MYTTYFGLKENPFNLTPDPRYLFLSRRHQEALSHLRYGIKERKGFILITGNIGTGKTTLIRAMLADLDRNVKTALIFNAYISDQEILHAINHEFGIPSDKELTNKQCIDILNQFLLNCFEKGENAVLFLDEAQNLSSKVLEQIRMLSNLETEKEKLLQIVMVGQNELKDILGASGLRQLNDRIAVRYDLYPLDRKDVRSYVIHRLTVAGAKGMIHFTRWAFRALYKASKGNPRIINAICDRSLLIAYSRDKFTIDREIICQAALNVKGQRYVYMPKGSFNWFVTACTILIIAVGVLLGGWYYQINTIHWVQEWFDVKISNHISSNTKQIDPQKPDETPIALASMPEAITQTGVKEHNQISDNPEDLSASAIISRMTQVTGDIVLSESEKNEWVQKEIVPQVNHAPVEKAVSMTEQQESHTLTQVTISPKNITESAHVKSYTENREPERAIEFSTFQPFVQQEYRQSPLSLSMETVVPKELAQKKKPEAQKDDLSFFLGEPWEQGMTAPEIMWVQQTLNGAGYPVKVTGVYSKETVAAIKRLQADFGLDVDGIIGPQSKWALYQLSTTKLEDYRNNAKE